MKQIKRWLEPPIFPDDLDKTRKAQILYVLQGSILAFLLFATFGALFVFVNKGLSLAIIGILLVFLLISYGLALRGRVLAASRLFVGELWILFSISLFLTGRFNTVFASLHLAVIVMAGVLLGRRSAITFSLLSILVGLGLAILEMTGYPLIRYFPGPPLTAWFVWMLSFSLILTPLTPTIQNIAQSAIALHEKQRFIEGVLTAIPDIIHIYDLQEKRSIFTSRSLITLLGYTSKESQAVNGDFPNQLIHPEDHARLSNMYEIWKMVKYNEALTTEYRMQAKSGEWRWFLERDIVFQRGAGGQVRQFVGTIQDITERKRAEDALRLSEARLKEAERIALLGHWELDILQDKLYWSDEIYRIFEVERTPKDVSYEDFIATVHPEDRELVTKAYTESLEAKTPYSINHRIMVRDGRIKYVHEQCETFYNAQGQAIRSIGTVHDITRQKRDEEQLRKLSLAVEAAPVTVVITDKDGRIEYANPSFVTTTGYETSEALGQNPKILKSGLTSPETYVQLWETILKGQPWEGEFINKKKNGELYVEQAHISPICDARGEIAHFVAVKLDITQRKESERSIRRYNEQLSAVVKIEHDMAATLDEDAIIASLPGGIQQIFPDVATIFISRFDPEREIIRAVYGSQDGNPVDVTSLPELPLAPEGQGTQSKVIRSCQPLVINSNLKESFHHKKPMRVGSDDKDTQSALFVPIVLQGNALGLIQLQSYEEDRFTEDDVRILTLIANATAISLENARLYKNSQNEIAERKQAENALAKAEALYRHLFEHSRDAVMLIDPETTRSVEFNSVAHNQLGYSREEFADLVIADYEAIETPDETAHHIELLRRDGMVDFETLQRTKNGELRNVHVWVKVLDLNDKTYFYAIMRDITERKQAEEELRKRDERYQNFVSQSFEAIYRTEFDRPIDISLPVETQIDLIYENAYMAECNQALADMYGLASADEMIGMRLIDAHGGKDNPTNRDAFRRLIENGYKSVNDETLEYKTNGEAVWFLSNTVGIVQNGWLTRLWGTSIDITERKQAEHELHQAHEQLAATLNALPDLLFEIDRKGVFYNFHAPKLEDLFAPPEFFLGKSFWEILPPEAAQVIETAIVETMANGRHNGGIYSLPLLDGDQWFELSMTTKGNIELPDGRLIVLIRNITSRKQAEEELLKSEQRFRTLFEQAAVGVALLETRTGRYMRINQKYCDFLGYAPEEMLQRTHRDVTYSEDATENFDYISASLINGDISEFSLEKRYMRKDGQVVWGSLSVSPLWKSGEKPDVYYHIAVVIDITDRKQAEEELRVSEEKFSTAFRLSADVITITSLKDGRIIEVNDSAKRVLGYTRDEVISKSTIGLKIWADPAQRKQYTANLFRDGFVHNFETQLLAKSGKLVDIVLSGGLIELQGDKYILSTFSDITERKRMEHELERLATTDSLTGLYNRRGFFEICHREIGRLQRYNRPISILFIDVDHFKQFNDLYSYEVGDRVLKLVAKTLKEYVREIDIVGRYGGEEMVILLPEVNESSAAEAAERLRMQIEKIRITLEQGEVGITVSIGVAGLSPVEEETTVMNAENQVKIMEDLIAKAGEALHLAKQQGRNQVTTFRPNKKTS